MRSRKNPYTPGALRFQKDVPEKRNEYIDNPVHRVVFTEGGFELLPSDGSRLAGVVFRAGTKIVEYMDNVANAAILVESALRELRQTTHIDAFVLLFDPRESKRDSVIDPAALEVSARLTDTRRCEVSVRSPIAFATKALCVVVVENILNCIDPRTEKEMLMLSKLAEPLRFHDLRPSELKFETVGGGAEVSLGQLERYAIERVHQADRDVVDRLGHAVSYIGAQPAISLNVAPEIGLLTPFRSAITKFFVTSVGDRVGLAEDWSHGLWSGLELFADGRSEIRITRFTEQFASWDAGLFVQDSRARQQICVFIGLIGHIYSTIEPTGLFKSRGSVRISLSRGAPQLGERATLRAEVIQGAAEILEITFDGDARAGLLSASEIEQSIFNLLSRIASIATLLDIETIRRLVGECVRGGLIKELKQKDFGPMLVDLNPRVPQVFSKSAYLSAYTSALNVAGEGIQVYPDIQDATEGAVAFGKFPKLTDLFSNTKIVGKDIYGGRLDAFLLNPRAGGFCVVGGSRIGITPNSPAVISQLAAVACALGEIAREACADAGMFNAPVTVALLFDVSKAGTDPTRVQLRYPSTGQDGLTLAMDATPNDATLALDQMDAIGVYPTLFVNFYSANELYKTLFTQEEFNRFCAAVRRILKVKGARGIDDANTIPFVEVGAAELGYRQPKSTAEEDAGSLKSAVVAQRQDFERALLRAAVGGDTLDANALEEVQASVRQMGQLVEACVYWGYQTEALRDRVMFRSAPKTPSRELTDTIWATRCMTFQILAEVKSLFAQLINGGAVDSLKRILVRQEKDLTAQVSALNVQIVTPGVQKGVLEVLESRRQGLVNSLSDVRGLLEEFEAIPNYIRELTSEVPEVELSTAELAVAESLFESVSSSPPPRITVPPSRGPADTFLPPSDSPPDVTYERLGVRSALGGETLKVFKCLELKGDSHISDVLETSAVDYADAAAVDCMALGELRWLVKSLRQGMANVQGALDIDVAGTYRFTYTPHEGVSYTIDPASARTEPCVTVYISTRLDISHADVVETVYQAVAECMEYLHELSGTDSDDADGEGDVDRFDIYDALTEF